MNFASERCGVTNEFSASTIMIIIQKEKAVRM